MNTDDIYTAIDHQIPAMRQRGFTIGTTAGQISIAPGWLADRLAQHLTQALQCELLYRTRVRHLEPLAPNPNRRQSDHAH